MLAFCRWLEHTAVGASIRESLWLFPAIETVHLLGMAMLLGTVAAYDLRLLGCVMRQRRVSDLSRRLLPWCWLGFALQVVTGTLLFSSEAVKIYTNPAFRLKMLLILLSGVQALVFQRLTYRNVSTWDADAPTPASAKLAGCLSLLLWTGVVAAGRFIGFV
jgi:uncharacterized membrane protein